MSAKGQKRTWMLFDHLVCTSKHCWRDCKAQCPSGLKIDRQLVLSRRLHRHVGGLLALEDAVDVAGRAPILVDKISSIRDQTAARDKLAAEVDRGQSVAGRKFDDQIALNGRQRARHHDQTAIT